MGRRKCRFCGDTGGQFVSCPRGVTPAQGLANPCPCSAAEPCFFDPSCPGLGCGALGHAKCRFCGGTGGQFKACPAAAPPKALAQNNRLGKQTRASWANKTNGLKAAAPQASQLRAAPPPLPPPPPPPPPTTATTTAKTKLMEPAASGSMLSFDIFRSMAAAAVDTHPMEDDDVADLGGVLKYVHTEILTEHLQNPLRINRKYDIDSLAAHRYKIKNTQELLNSDVQTQGEFGQFVTFDWGQATNTAQLPMLSQYGNFVGIQPCSQLECDVRFPSERPYAWLSVGNRCPNFAWDKKGSKLAPAKDCLQSGKDANSTGGLCPHGFDAEQFVPRVEPTGDQNCVYSYGKAKVVLLDDLVGITREDCGGRACHNWLDFRLNCTEASYKQQFAANGSILSVGYCVEFDIHPLCEANCAASHCNELLSSGSRVSLGLPFWQDRCNARANDRRTEEVAYAFGIPGALSSHRLVPDELSSRPCPLSKGSGWACAPEVPGQGGPYCTRAFNGACDRCFIPGAADEGAASVPWCPLDILSGATYKDRSDFPMPACTSRRASEGCCLYSGSCDGDSDPRLAHLDDDGLSLVAARRSTSDMLVFLKRAVQADGRLQGLRLDEEKMHWIAYFAWQLGPVQRSLSEALEELSDLMASPHPVVTLVRTTTTTTTSAVLSRTTGPSQAPSCFEDAVSFVPLDLAGAPMSLKTEALACQRRCAKVAGCKHFSFLKTSPELLVGYCHLQGLSGLAQLGSVGWVSGPYACWEDIEDTSLMIDKGHHTYVPPEFACMEWGVVYSPELVGQIETFLATDFPGEELATLQCQKKCAKVQECAHFTMSFPTRLCTLAANTSTGFSNVAGALSGPPRCKRKDMQSYYWEVLPAERLWAKSVAGYASILGGFSFVAAGLALVVVLNRSRRSWSYSACSARSAYALSRAEDSEVSDEAAELLL
ncbi:unnamed protein product [Polarella glacialis]|uniref:Apple domain-containing protein n=1 Tax=Polarella glacialis TaxID=89957 RepID=A0A813LKE9_POLGL|nr:unnamed protein product [Polarella glacialis]